MCLNPILYRDNREFIGAIMVVYSCRIKMALIGEKKSSIVSTLSYASRIGAYNNVGYSLELLRFRRTRESCRKISIQAILSCNFFSGDYSLASTTWRDSDSQICHTSENRS